jgi:hypothetical protein
MAHNSNGDAAPHSGQLAPRSASQRAPHPAAGAPQMNYMHKG